MPPVNHASQHPDIHQPWAEWSEDQTLHVAVCYSNPFRWRTRRELANDCIRHLAGSANVKLYVGELAYGARPFEVTEDLGKSWINPTRPGIVSSSFRSPRPCSRE